MKMSQIDKDIRFMKLLLPMHYSVLESKKTTGSVHCKSSIGLTVKDNEFWEQIIKDIKKHFGKRFQEVYHNTCTNHCDFIVYLKNKA